MGTYASKTTVDQDRSRAEIERILERYGATSFAYFKDGERAVLMFEAEKRRVSFRLALPQRDEFKTTETGKWRKSAHTIDEAYQQAVRQRWRALTLVIKAKLESVESGIETFEEAFMAHILLPDGQKVGQWMSPQIKLAYETAQMPPMLPSGNGQ